MVKNYIINKDIFLIMSIVLVLYLAFCYALFEFMQITSILIIGILLIKMTQSFKDFFRFLLKKLNMKNKLLGKGIIFSLSFLTVIFTLFLFGQSFSQLSDSLNEAIEKKPLRDYFLSFEKRLQDKNPFIYENTIAKLDSAQLLKFLEDNVISFSGVILTEFFSFLFIAIILIPLIFLTRKKISLEKFSESVLSKFDKKIETIFENMARMISDDINNFLRAKVKQIIILTVVASAGFLIIGLKGWFVLGFFLGLINIIPFFGPIIGLIPALFFGLSQSLEVGVLVLVVVLIVQIVDNVYIQPVLIPKLISIDSLLSVTLTLIGSSLFGSAGLILFVPMYLVLRIILREVYFGLLKFYDHKK